MLGLGLNAMMDGDRSYVEFVKGPHEAAGDLAAIGDQNLAERQSPRRRAEAGGWLGAHARPPDVAGGSTSSVQPASSPSGSSQRAGTATGKSMRISAIALPCGS